MSTWRYRKPAVHVVVATLALASHLSHAQQPAPHTLNVAIVQMSVGPTLSSNRDRIIAGIEDAAARRARVVVFPEGALCGRGAEDPATVKRAAESIRAATRAANVYTMFGGFTYLPHLKKHANWMLVVGPDGRDVFRYEKMYDNHRAAMPGVFLIDGTACSAMICADRWLRAVEELPIHMGAQISFELSNNFASEWVAPLQWYWYVPRAMRNNVWVVFANTANRVTGVPDNPAAPLELRHGHSAVVGPDGRMLAAAQCDTETLIVAQLDIPRATRAEATARSSSSVLHRFWQAGLALHRGIKVDAPPTAPLQSAETDITLAAAQVTGRAGDLLPWIAQARSAGADLVAFPAQACDEDALEQLGDAARKHRITVVIGMNHDVDHGHQTNAAYVIGPDGTILTRYDQISASGPFQPGTDPTTMWFSVKGVPAVVTIGRDALWNELAELAAVAGAQLHIHLEHRSAGDPDAALRQLQVWAAMASYQTFTATVNVTRSAIWDDLRTEDERRAAVRGLQRSMVAPVEVYSPFSANLVVRAGSKPQLITATRHVGPRNRYHPNRTIRLNPQMRAWYRTGAAAIRAGQLRAQ